MRNSDRYFFTDSNSALLLASMLSKSETTAESHTAPDLARQKFQLEVLRYLDDIRLQFKDRPEVYPQFLSILADFKNQKDVQDVTIAVVKLFEDHPSLLEGFRAFLPGQRTSMEASVSATSG
ncbi:hypothetical protein BDZ89DRAFT_283120 [Hymenopellis radicata]|nr:hypothetical protein BDZ89DRAFT_283120 [Hymenopellis radicata]